MKITVQGYVSSNAVGGGGAFLKTFGDFYAVARWLAEETSYGKVVIVDRVFGVDLASHSDLIEIGGGGGPQYGDSPPFTSYSVKGLSDRHHFYVFGDKSWEHHDLSKQNSDDSSEAQHRSSDLGEIYGYISNLKYHERS